MARLLLLAALVAATSALNCYTCDSFLTCNAPRVEYCPIATTCYTLRRDNQVALKGCTAGCSTLPNYGEPGVQCRECNSDKCNSDGHGSPNMHYEQQPPANFNNELLLEKKRRSIGHGAGIQQPSHIGSGVSGGSGGGYNAYGNNGGNIGNRHHDNKHGHQGGGIGGGASPNNNRHHRRERSYGSQHPPIGSGVSGGSGGGYNTYGGNVGSYNHHANHQHPQPPTWNHNEYSSGIGGGVRPRAAATSMTFVPVMILVIVRLFQ